MLTDSSIEVFIVVVSMSEAMWSADSSSEQRRPIENYCVRVLIPKEVETPLPPPTVRH